MVNYRPFDEAYYQQNYPDVNAAVNTPRGFISGLEHFDLYGRRERRVEISPFYNEDAYLLRYPDVAAAVAAGAFTSGAQHFVEFGYDEGRFSPIGTPETGLFNSEEVYLRRYPDVATAVASGAFRSGYQHFTEFGRFEGRSPTYFNEQDYITLNTDVAEAVRNGTFTSGFDHYVRFGQFEDRLAFFSGTPGNDVVTSFGFTPTELTGVDYVTLTSEPFSYGLRSNGRGEIDTLIGNTASNNFLLALSTNEVNLNNVQLYVGGGAADYAIIRNFVRGSDTIQLTGSLENYSQEAAGGNLSIFTRGTRDLVAVVEGVTTPLSVVNVFSGQGTFAIG